MGSWNDWTNAGRPVRGHLCGALATLQAASSYTCIPKFDEDGTLTGCDDHNPTAILFCPMCGEQLPPPEGSND